MLVVYCCGSSVLIKLEVYDSDSPKDRTCIVMNGILQRVTETQNTVNLTDRMWARLLASTNQPSFFESNELLERVDKEDVDVINHNMRATSI